ncbi:MAG: MarR family transcriptional regulator [Myxococcales bacterium]|nr:MarR family transcriptional regulator [Myxococcales bacterium]
MPRRQTAAIDQAKKLLGAWLDHPRFRVGARDGPDLLVEDGALKLAVELGASAEAASVSRAVAHAKQCVEGQHAMPVVATPFMGELGKRICDEAGISWFDLSGNARIVAPGLRIIIEGKPNRFLRRGRPSSAFAPKSARVARHLLVHHPKAFRQRDLARETGLDDGFTSRIVRRLEGDGLVERDEKGLIHARDPDLLLDAWSATYSFDKHAALRGHVTARSGDELLQKLAAQLSRSKLQHAATGLSAAWLRTEFAGFRLVSFFVGSLPSDKALDAMGFREEPKGANVWLVVPNDDGVFDGASKVGGIECVHPLQAYLDLLAHPERAKEAAAELRSRALKWKS